MFCKIREWRTSDAADLATDLSNKKVQDNLRDGLPFPYKESDAVCCSGNILKFFILPTAGSITALNLPEWTFLIKHTIFELRYQLRDKSIEKVISNRDTIEANWINLLSNNT